MGKNLVSLPLPFPPSRHDGKKNGVKHLEVRGEDGTGVRWSLMCQRCNEGIFLGMRREYAPVKLCVSSCRVITTPAANFTRRI